ncbi:Ger(x)C family germination protein [Tumebacillus sp. BK434]|uniref:Ger(x)C family spore germination protein n=1 Tax=Tumebacillus sp. BK434 TaxID=2512169 RepID=UPI0010534D3A|nr:Ger(x)C family spore germination protein [Tumebacillus sp. BK434]TCP55870.1 Ger(x)C family germination protein [Tumebacillus sp. BK434]
MKKRRLHLISLLLLLPFLSGCWDVKDINHRALPAAMAIDRADTGDYIVWLKIPKIGGSRNSYIIARGHHASISKAIDLISSNLDRTVDLLHVKLIFLSERLAKNNTKEVIDYALRTREIGNKTKIAVVRGDMSTFFESSHKSVAGSTSTSYDNFFSKTSGWTPDVVRSALWQVYRGSRSDTEDSLLPIVKRGESTMLFLVGSCLMKNEKLVAEYTPQESLIYNVYKGEFRNGIVQTLDHGAVRLLSADVENDTSRKGKQPVLHVKFKVKVTTLESKAGVTDAMLIRDLKMIFKKRFAKLIEISQQAHADVLGIGQHFRHHYSNEELNTWKDELFSQMETHIDVEVTIRNRGLLRN